MIKAFIVDDEEHNRDVLKMLLNKHSPNVEIIGEANNVNDAYVMIYNLKPQLVFLDVISGLSVNSLNLFKNSNFFSL